MKNTRLDRLFCASRKALCGGGVAAIWGAGVLSVRLSAPAVWASGQGRVFEQGPPLGARGGNAINDARRRACVPGPDRRLQERRPGRLRGFLYQGHDTLF